MKNKDEDLIPSSGMEDTIYHLPVIEIWASVGRGWWAVEVRCEPTGPWYTGKKDRSYFSALAKALDAAMKGTGHTE